MNLEIKLSCRLNKCYSDTHRDSYHIPSGWWIMMCFSMKCYLAVEFIMYRTHTHEQSSHNLILRCCLVCHQFAMLIRESLSCDVWITKSFNLIDIHKYILIITFGHNSMAFKKNLVE